jgi:hypothetical protein
LGAGAGDALAESAESTADWLGESADSGLGSAAGSRSSDCASDVVAWPVPAGLSAASSDVAVSSVTAAAVSLAGLRSLRATAVALTAPTSSVRKTSIRALSSSRHGEGWQDPHVPSYRVSLAVGILRPGVDPAVVLPAVADAARGLTTVEASDVGVVRGRARVTVRFVADDDAAAHRVADAVRDRVDALAATSDHRLTRRWGNRWYAA